MVCTLGKKRTQSIFIAQKQPQLLRNVRSETAKERSWNIPICRQFNQLPTSAWVGETVLMQLPQWQLATSGEGLSDPSYVK